MNFQLKCHAVWFCCVKVNLKHKHFNKQIQACISCDSHEIPRYLWCIVTTRLVMRTFWSKKIYMYSHFIIKLWCLLEMIFVPFFKKAFSSHKKQATCSLNPESLSSFDSSLHSAEIQVSYNECQGHAITSDIPPNSVRTQPNRQDTF